jgi:hypothetical protein
MAKESRPPEISEAAKRLRKQSRSQKLAWCQKVFQGPQAVRRDFVLFDTSDAEGFKSNTIIMHLPTMLWRGFDFSFETGLKSLDDPRCDDKELIRCIYGVD